MSSWTRSFHAETASSMERTAEESLTSQLVSRDSAPRLTPPRSRLRRLMSAISARLSSSTFWSTPFAGRKTDGEGERFGMRSLLICSTGDRLCPCGCLLILDNRPTSQHGDQRSRHDQGKRDMRDEEQHDRGHAEEMHKAR